MKALFSSRAFLYRPAFLALFTADARRSFFSDLGAGVTVGIIALPLAIGFGMASGVAPGQGLWTAIVGGFIISVFGGSRQQIGGPTGAFVPVLAAVVAAHGYDGLALATLLAGLLLVLMGIFRLGALLRYIPYPVIAGFTSGIAVIIFLGQLPEFLGLSFKRPGDAPELAWEVGKHLRELDWTAWPTWETPVVGGLGLLVVFLWPRLTRRVPAAIVAVVATTLLVYFLQWPVATIGTRFGGLPSGFPDWHLPAISLEKLRALAGSAFTIAALGAIESLLSATVADGMADTRHDSNSELIGQGLANLAVPFVGGIAATGAIARTAASIRSGGRSPLAGMVHAVVLLAFVLFAAPLARFIPLAGLAAVLMGVAVRMAEWDTFRELRRSSRSDFAVLLTTFVLTVVFDLTVGVAVGLVIAVVLFVKRMENISHVKLLTPDTDSEFDGSNSLRGKSIPDGVVLFRFEGPLFFAAVEKLEAALRAHAGKPRLVIFRLRHVPAVDATALHSLEVAVEKMHRDGVTIVLTAVQPQPMKVFYESGLAERIGLDNFCANLDEALVRAGVLLGK
ncbi:MAG: SulP family inorganic anion transporter [Verrucomicrobiales bacterium]|nr:SulP family inorganic anion transporter [Verrucomicrobiales bacterium]